MDIKIDLFQEYTKYTIHEVENRRELFDEYGLEKIHKIAEFESIASSKNKKFIILNANQDILENEKDTLEKSSYELFRKSYKTVAASSDKELLKIYFKDDKPNKVNGKLDLTLKALKRGMLIMENPSYDEINHLKDDYIDMINKLDEFLSNYNEKSEELSIAKSESLEANHNWREYYTGLKHLVQFQLIGKGVDYRIFFLDLAK